MVQYGEHSQSDDQTMVFNRGLQLSAITDRQNW